ncbi:hypothetical protein C5B96_00825 [Subtercola sp. Z020]|uniref:tetratricopeptide repeat protein n=1 Tax=Subtercola sp. Z020 TaxID=2080582 RepID=UPI000CE8895A|nr:tetratricopeptide repeat protein [Subtercola sp. Z020]PPF89717.1 hypothetical protein C5B96_00825 [Subtercola sp. Z020]
MSSDIQNHRQPQPPIGAAGGQNADHLLFAADRLPAGGVRGALLAEVLRLAQTSGDTGLEYRARLRIADAATRGGASGELLAHAEWCLERHLDDAERFAARVPPYDLAVVLAAVPGALASNTRCRLSTVNQVLDELCELMSEGDDGPAADLLKARARFEVADACGNVSELRRRRAHVERLLRRSRGGGGAGGLGAADADAGGGAASGLSVGAGAGVGAAAGSAANAGPAFAAGRRIAESLVPLLENGQLSDAYLEHLRGCALLQESPPDPCTLALHVDFCSAGGYLERGLLLVRLHLAALVSDPFDERSQLLLLLAFGALLDLVCESAPRPSAAGESRSGAGAAPASHRERGEWMLGPHVPIAAAEHPALRAVLGELPAPVTAEALSDACWAAAQRIALAFDRRNGNTAFSDRVAQAEVLSDRRVAALVAGISPAAGTAGAAGTAAGTAGAARSADGTAGATSETADPAATISHTSSTSDTSDTSERSRVGRSDDESVARRGAVEHAGRDRAGIAEHRRSARSAVEWLRMARERASVEDSLGAADALRAGHDVLDRASATPKRAPAAHRPSGLDADARRPGTEDTATELTRMQGQTGSAAEHPPLWPAQTGAGTTRTGAAGMPPMHSAGAHPAAENAATAPQSFAPAGDETERARTRAALRELEIRLAVERGDRERAEQVAAWRIDDLYAAERIDLAEVETELGLLLFGVPPERRRGDLERELARTRDEQYDAEAQVSILNALGELRLREGRAGEAVGYLLSSVALCGHDPDSAEVQRPLALLAHAQVALGEAAWARATLDRLLRHDLDRAMRANALLLRAGLVQQADDPRCALDDADRALSLYLELRYGKGVIDACVALASLLEELRIRPGVIEAWRMAVAEAEAGSASQAGSGGDAACDGSAGAGSALTRHPALGALRFRLARALVDADRGAEAAAELLRAYDELPGGAELTANDSHEVSRLDVLLCLANAHRLADDDDASAATLHLALAQARSALDARGEVHAGLALARLQLDNDDPACIVVLQHTLAAARRIPDVPHPSPPTDGPPFTGSPSAAQPPPTPPGLAHAAVPPYGAPAEGIAAEVDTLHLLGVAQCAFGYAGGLATLDRAIELASRHAFDIDALLAAVTESRARAYDDLGREAEAVETSARAARLFERMLDRASAGQAHLFTARLLVTQNRHDEALPIYRRSLDMLPPDTPVADLAASEWHATATRAAALAAPTPRPAVTADPR